jgi:MFS family permease
MWLPVVLLGLATIGAYGTTQYAIGTLLPAIAAAEGWSIGTLAGSYALAVLTQGAVALIAGHEFDRRGSRRVLLTALIVGALALFSTSFASSPWTFMLGWAAGGAAFGGGMALGDSRARARRGGLHSSRGCVRAGAGGESR